MASFLSVAINALEISCILIEFQFTLLDWAFVKDRRIGILISLIGLLELTD